jgi:hypothetical protein
MPSTQNYLTDQLKTKSHPPLVRTHRKTSTKSLGGGAWARQTIYNWTVSEKVETTVRTKSSLSHEQHVTNMLLFMLLLMHISCLFSPDVRE